MGETFYKTRVTLVVLSTEPIPEAMDIDTIVAEFNDGAYVLHSAPPMTVEILNRAEIREALVEAGSTADFFDAIDTDEDEYEEIETMRIIDPTLFSGF